MQTSVGAGSRGPPPIDRPLQAADVPGCAIKERFMSQQEFEPGLQSKQDSLNEDEEIQYPQYPYSWSGKLHREGVPRDEPPSSYDTTMMQRGYQEQSSGNPNATGSSQPKLNGGS